MKEILKEVYSSISRHKMRTLLTGFGTAWGIFILIVLLGAGNGFRSGILMIFSSYASNSIWVSGQWTSQASVSGIQSGSKVKFNRSIIAKLKNRFSQINYISSEIKLKSPYQIGYQENIGNFEVKGIDHDYNIVKLLEIKEGRYFNNFDYEEERRVVIIGNRVKEVLFVNENPIGKQINISGVFFQIIGVLKEGTVFSIMEQNNIYAPNISLRHIFNLDSDFYTFGVLLHKNALIENFETELRHFLAREVGFKENDKNALFFNNIQLQIKTFNSLFDSINIFLWILGLCFLLSGIISIANIMLVVVKERTTEIGIRKAIGATPRSIIILIISEAIITTLIFGIFGLISGYLGVEIYNWIISSLQTGNQVLFAKASINWYVVLMALLILIISGILAGIYPARKAAKIMPVETLNKVV